MKLGTITFGKSRPAPKAVLVDVTMDDETNRELYKIGLQLLKIDKDAVVAYVIAEALKYAVKK